MKIEQRKAAGTWAWLELGFRPFFLGAAGFAVVSVLVWMGVLVFGWPLRLNGLPPVTWHAHEMIYGYSLAVIAGFLLTAIRNWTDRPTLHGVPLLLLFLLWAAGRIVPFLGDAAPLEVAAVTDTLFMVVLLVSAAWPVVQVRQWGQLGVLLILVLMLAGNLTFYLGALHRLPNGIFWGLYSGLYLILALIFKMGRRVIPTFIEVGAGSPVRLKNWRWVDLSSLPVFLLFWIADLLTPNGAVVALLAGLLFVLHGVRLAGWYTPGIWKKPLLWVLYLAYGSLTAGFALKAAVFVFHISPYLAVHAFTVGGIGMMTMGMMARVSLGHTGRSVLNPPAGVFWMFAGLFAAAIVRVLLPLLNPSQYVVWIGLSQVLWISAFALFLSVYAPMLVGSERERG
ncbi:MAG: NnrS family protein [Nitrospirae bacterium]|nr:NnrS family protein [Nitrospirota bacterium]